MSGNLFTYFVASLHACNNALDIRTHQRQRRCRVDICKPDLCRLTVKHRYQPSSHHRDESERLVLVLAR
jgi:hypothetical protein